ncbi:uncharacterized protein DUF4241 [Roseimicrobium gellanilyticum]|uniref:Uncharacterized protein DUF4241 n=1 Tax=Roseimicrobium gellanilyticum TaxID=748857 RepID=A0A366HQK1_9BACT|nr:DUF4241 domain-containing protein [Roseimicrobium gellanilyticum]RBP44474.1 uncharacterized protein DUF4241 [Roseimicrobium gellanilyticum]
MRISYLARLVVNPGSPGRLRLRGSRELRRRGNERSQALRSLDIHGGTSHLERMPQRTRILLTYAIGIALLWVLVFWLRHLFPSSEYLKSFPSSKTSSSLISPTSLTSPTTPPVTPQNTPPSSEGSTPEARVEAYIREWHAAWLQSAKPHLNTMLALSMPQKDGSSPGIKDFMKLQEGWNQIIRGVQKRHSSVSHEDFSDLESSMGHPPSHAPGGEVVTKVHVESNGATVTTRLGDSPPEFNVYQLTKGNGSWYIRSIDRFFSDETEAAFTDEERTAILAKVTPDAALPELKPGAAPNCDRLFTEGRKVTFLNKEHTLHVHSGGMLSVPSGVLGVHHLGAFPEEMRPLTLRITPGDHACEYAEVDGTVAAARLLLDKSSPAVTYRPAHALEAEDNEASVNHGNVAVFDAAAFMQVSKRAHEEHFQHDYVDHVLAPGSHPENPTPIRLGNPPSGKTNCLVISMDGGCLCYWGLDASGKPVSLILDFLVIAEQLKDRCKLPWPPVSDGPSLTHPTLQSHQTSIHLGKEGGRVTFQVKGDDFFRAIWRSANGSMVADTDGMGFVDTGAAVTYTFQEGMLDKATEIEVELHAGHRN